jgi:integrase
MDSSPLLISTQAPGDLGELTLAPGWTCPADQNPVLVYLGRLAPASRRPQGTGLRRVATFLSGGLLTGPEAILQLPWPEVRYQHVQRVRAWLADEAGLSPATGNTYLAAVRGVLTECWRLGYLSAEDRARALDIKRIGGSRLPRGRALAHAELQAVLDQLAAEDTLIARRDTACLAVMYASGGVRRTELTALDLGDCDVMNGELTVRSGKGRKERRIHLSAEGAAAVADWLAVRGLAPGPLFLPISKDRRTLEHGRSLDPTTIRLLCQRRAARAGVAPFSPHDLRRSSISDLLDLSGDLGLVSRLAGHANPAVTARYDRRPVDAEQRAARSLLFPYHTRRLTNSQKT